MGYAREKYTKEYFLKQDVNGNKTNVGVEGLEEFKMGKIRLADERILSRINFIKKNVLDMGFGRGEAIKFSLEHGANKVIGVDFARDSQSIATELLRHYQLNADLYCKDALSFLKNYQKLYPHLKQDIVLMLDFIKHVPRQELKKILILLQNIVSNESILVINTPVFKIDNDVLKEGLKDGARDTSDESEITAGMHCNRYTKKTLIKFMREAGFKAITPRFFALSFKGGISLTYAQKWSKAKKNGFPLRGSYKKDTFEKVIKSSDLKENKWRRILSPRRALPYFIPPIAPILKEVLFGRKITPPHVYKPIWHKIKGGVLRGKWFYIDTHDNGWQREIIEGTYDKFFFDFLKKYNLEGKTIFDVGAFVGSHSLAFAQMVGKNGKVFSFEPNEFNISRMKKIFNRNKDLGKRIKIVKAALSDRNGSAVFSFSSQIDNGFSSGGFVEGSDTPREEAEYEKSHFKKCSVKSVKLDDLEARMKIKESPFIIKIDTEGAEGKILESGQKYLKKHKPVILVEIHSPKNMIHTVQVLSKLGYEISILKKENDGRVFLSANPDIKNKSYAEIYPKN